MTKLIPSRIPLAQVRTHDLNELPTGEEKFLSYQRELDLQRYAAINAYLPDYSEAAALPDIRDSFGYGSLLPPLDLEE